MQIKDIIVENEPNKDVPKLSMKELDVKAKEELTDKFHIPVVPRQTEYFNISFQATIPTCKNRILQK